MHSLIRKELRERYFGDYDALPLIYYNKVWPIDTVSDVIYDMLHHVMYEMMFDVMYDMMYNVIYDV